MIRGRSGAKGRKKKKSEANPSALVTVAITVQFKESFSLKFDLEV